MTIQEELSAELKAAMRDKDKPRLAVIRQVETEVSRVRSEPGFDGEVDDGLYEKVIGSYVKKMEKAREEYVALGERGEEQASKLAFEVEYLSRWLPQSMGEEETRAIVQAAIAELEASDPSMTGRVMGQIMKAGHAGLDGGLVNRLVREELSGE